MNPDADVVRAEMEHLWEDDAEVHSVELDGLRHRDVMLLVMGLEKQAIEFHLQDQHDTERDAMDLRDQLLSEAPDLTERVERVRERADAGGVDVGPTHHPRLRRIATGAILVGLWASGVLVGALFF